MEASTVTGNLGRYEIRGVLGSGAMALVLDGWDPVIGRRAAIKTIRRDQLETPDAAEVVERFKREAQAAGRLNHPNIVSVYEYGEDQGIAYIAMEFITGKELKDYFDRGERFPIPTAVRIMTEILSALELAHRHGIVHRDIKPGNIFLSDTAQGVDLIHPDDLPKLRDAVLVAGKSGLPFDVNVRLAVEDGRRPLWAHPQEAPVRRNRARRAGTAWRC